MEQAGVIIFGVILSAVTVGVLTGVAGSVLVWRGLPLRKLIVWLLGLSVGTAIGWAVTSAYVHPIFDGFWETLRVNGIIATLLWSLYAIPNVLIVFFSLVLKGILKVNKVIE